MIKKIWQRATIVDMGIGESAPFSKVNLNFIPSFSIFIINKRAMRLHENIAKILL